MHTPSLWMQQDTANVSRMRAAGPVCHWQGHKFLSVHQHFSLPPVAYEACRCSRKASWGAPLPPPQMDRRPRCDRTECKDEADQWGNLSSIGTAHGRKAGRAIGEPQPLFYIASSHHPSIRGRFTESHRRKWKRAAAPALDACSYPSPTTTHLIACIAAEAGGFQGTGAGASIDPTGCAEVSDESSGPVRSAMEPQCERGRWRAVPSDSGKYRVSLKEQSRNKGIQTEEERVLSVYFRLRFKSFTKLSLVKIWT